MARYGATTTLPPKRVILLAREHFGPDSRLGLPIAKESWNEATFEGGGGAVTVTALPRAGDLGVTDVSVASREYDDQAVRFLVALAGATGPLARLHDLWRRVRRAARRR